MRSRRLLPILFIGLAALLVGACGKPPLVPIQPKAPTTWLPGIAVACTTVTTDPSGGQVSYQFDWGDNNTSVWSPFMNGGVPYADTHSYANRGSYKIKVRAKNSKRASGWSEPLTVRVAVEGDIAWSIDFVHPDDPEDSAEFTNSSFAIGSDNTTFIGSQINGAVIARNPSGSVAWKFYTPEFDEFTAAPLLADDGTILIGCTDEVIYALNADGSIKWQDSVGGAVNATGALGTDGTTYFQTTDSMVIALSSGGTTLWTFPSGGGNSAPVVGPDGTTVFVVNQDGMVHALNAADGMLKWSYSLLAVAIQSPAIDPSRNRLYAVGDDGKLQTLDLTTGLAGWTYSAGEEASGAVVGPDGSVFVCSGGRLAKLSPDLGDVMWTFTPPLTGVMSTPAVTADGYAYVLVVLGKKKLALQGTDSLYAVNPDGTRRWACGLGEGLSDPECQLSAPKIGADGLIYVGDGFRGWCVVGVSAPAASAWPMNQHDARNTGRAQ